MWRKKNASNVVMNIPKWAIFQLKITKAAVQEYEGKKKNFRWPFNMLILYNSLSHLKVQRTLCLYNKVY